jgi:hypothetical protein
VEAYVGGGRDRGIIDSETENRRPLKANKAKGEVGDGNKDGDIMNRWGKVIIEGVIASPSLGQVEFPSRASVGWSVRGKSRRRLPFGIYMGREVLVTCSG